MEILFGNKPIYKFKEVIIDEEFGYPIMVDGKIVGGLLVELDIIKRKKCICIKGIEIDTLFREKGIAKEVLNKLKRKCDLIYGVITEENAIGFWKRMGSYLNEINIPVPDRVKHTMHIEKPICFYISEDKEAIKIFEDGFKREKKVVNLLKIINIITNGIYNR